MVQPKDLVSTLSAVIRKTVDDAFKAGPANIAAAVNTGGEGGSTSVYSDQDVTIVQQNGETQVFRRHRSEPDPGT